MAGVTSRANDLYNLLGILIYTSARVIVCYKCCTTVVHVGCFLNPPSPPKNIYTNVLLHLLSLASTMSRRTKQLAI